MKLIITLAIILTVFSLSFTEVFWRLSYDSPQEMCEADGLEHYYLIGNEDLGIIDCKAPTTGVSK